MEARNGFTHRQRQVEGTAVYGAKRSKDRSIERVMSDRYREGLVRRPELWRLSRIGDDTPLPWQSLKYDTGLGGYALALPRPN